MTESSEFRGDLAKRPLPACFWRAPAQALRFPHDLRPHFEVTLAALAFADGRTLSLASTPKFRDGHRLVELGNRAEHLAHEPRRRRVVEK